MNIADVLGAPVSDHAEHQLPSSSTCTTPAVDIANPLPVERTQYRMLVIAVVVALTAGIVGGWYVATRTTEVSAAVAIPTPAAAPAEVVGTAEMFAALYLTGATSADDLAAFYAGDTPPPSGTWVNFSQTVSAVMAGDDLWEVTVLVDSLESVDGEYVPVSLRYFLVTVSTATGRPIVAAAPAQIPPPTAAPNHNRFAATVPVDQASAASAFLEQYLTGSTDVARYLSATARIPLFATAPYVEAAANPRGADEQGRVMVAVTATNARGITHHLEYTLTLTFDRGVWEVADLTDGVQ